jgi:hypothetical protein
MPKGGSGSEDRAKVKLRVIEFELEGGNASVENSIRQITSALTTRNAAPKPLPARPPKELAAPYGAEGEAEDIAEAPEIVEAEAVETDAETRAPKGPKAKYKPPLPTYLHDMDVTGNGVSFKDFAAAKAPKKHTTRYLVAAMWLKEHGNSPTVTAAKVYTCYKTAGWPLNITDWDVNLRSQVKTDRFRRVETGEYAITPLGEADLQKPDGTA